MADSISNKWYSGQNPVPGTASIGYPYVDFKWNTGSGSSHAALTSPAFAYPGRYFTLVINAAADTITTADVVYTLYGSNNANLAIAKWDTVKTATIANAAITELTTFVEINTENDEGFFKFYKLKLDPSQNPGSARVVKVGINAPALNKG
tara:strand:- start:117 stop:566 length:450 start_codon:yes stop_codon:yes gene_type:complete